MTVIDHVSDVVLAGPMNGRPVNLKAPAGWDAPAPPAPSRPAGPTTASATAPGPDDRPDDEATEGKGGVHDAELKRAVRRAAFMRQCFYVVVLLVALAGQVSGAVEALGIPLLWAIFAVAGLELGGIVVLANADVRRRLGEHAIASRLLSVGIAAGAVGFNWIAHANKLHGGFFAGMSALGYLVWLMHTENQRRDRLRALGDLPPTTPAYELWSHWCLHPLVTAEARSLAKENPDLDLYGSLRAARQARARRRKLAAIVKVLKSQVRKDTTPAEADLIIATFDYDAIATMLDAGADNAGAAALVQARLDPSRFIAADNHDDNPGDAAAAPAAADDRTDTDAGDNAGDRTRRPHQKTRRQTHSQRRRTGGRQTHGDGGSVDAQLVARLRALGAVSDRQAMKALGVGRPVLKRLRAALDDSTTTP